MRVIRTQLCSICERLPKTVPARNVLSESFKENWRHARRQHAKNYPKSPRWLLETPSPTPMPKIFLPRKKPCLIPTRTPKKALVLDLPLEILDYIVSYLPIPSKVCLALCSTGLYQLYSTVLQDEQLSFPHMRLVGDRYLETDAYHHRMTLLMQLEDHRWLCCGKCQKLHPWKEWDQHNVCMKSPLTRSCMPGAGIVDLCPCISLTIRDKSHIIGYLLGKRTGKPPFLVSNGLLQDSYNEKKKRYTLWHKCGAYLTAHVEIELSITHGSQLLSSARYDVYPDIYAPWLLSLYICSHHTNLDECLEVHRDACIVCDTFSDILSSNSGSTAVRISRYLGPDEWRRNATPRRPPYFPHPWSRQMRDTTDYIPR